MERNAELERRIHENPGDREAYAVYGDWLSERGDPRGELVAVQLALDDPDHLPDAALRWREAHLLRTHAAHLLGVLAPFRVEARWRYGFLHAIALAAPLDLEGALPTEVLARALDRIEGSLLAEVKLTIGDQEIHLAHLAGRWPQVRKLSLASAGESSMFRPRDLGATFPNLEDLETGPRIDVRCSAPRLARLGVSAHVLLRTSLAGLVTIPRPRLRSLTIAGARHPYHFDELDLLLHGEHTPALRRLALTETDDTADILRDVATSPLAHQLRELDLGDGRFTDADAESLARGVPPALGELVLDLSENCLSPEGVATVRRVLPRAKLHCQKQEILADEDYG